MDGKFDHDDPNNRPEEIPLDDLSDINADDDNDSEYFDSHENPYGETSFISGGTHMEISNVDAEGRPNVRLKESGIEYQRLKKVRILKGVFKDISGREWNASMDSENTRDFLDNIEIKTNRESIWYKGKIVYKKVSGDRYVASRQDENFRREFRQQIWDINTDFLEKASSIEQSVDKLITVNTVSRNFYFVNIPVEIELKPRINNALDFNPEEYKVNEVENALYDIKEELKKVDPENVEVRRYYLILIDYLENNVDILRLRSGLSPKYNNLGETDYGRLRRLKDFLKRNFGVIAFVTTIVGGLAGLVITIISYVRGGVSNAAKGASKAGRSIWDFAKKVGAFLAPIRSALATVLSSMASNLWFLFLIISGVIYNILKKRKYI